MESVSTSRSKLPIHFNLRAQRHLQLSLSTIALTVTVLIIPANIILSGVLDIWVYISLALAVVGIVLDILGLIGLLNEKCLLLLTAQLLYNAGVMTPFRVIYVGR